MSPSANSFTPLPASSPNAKSARLPLGWRDACGALLIPLNVCRHETLYATWKCDAQRYVSSLPLPCSFPLESCERGLMGCRHEYEKCQYDECVSFPFAFSLRSRKSTKLSGPRANEGAGDSYMSRMRQLELNERQAREDAE